MAATLGRKAANGKSSCAPETPGGLPLMDAITGGGTGEGPDVATVIEKYHEPNEY